MKIQLLIKESIVQHHDQGPHSIIIIESVAWYKLC